MSTGEAAGHLLVIGGQRVEAAESAWYEVPSPVDGMAYGRLARAGVADVERAVSSARAAFEANLQKSPFERADWCHAAAGILASRSAALADLLCREHGKPRAQASAEIVSAAEGLRLAAEEAKRLGGRTIPVRDAGKLVLTVRKPRGVFAAITPFNFPANIPVEYLGPLIANGNAVIWKPAPTTSGIASALVECLQDGGVPAGLVSLLTGPDLAPAQALVSHPGVDGVCFTGSSAAGAAIATLAAGKAQLMELGGNGPIVVLADADLGLAARMCAAASFWNSGQSCAAAGRILVASSVRDDFVARLVEQARAEVVGSPFAASTTMGPVHTAAIGQTMRRHIDDALSRGARVLHGGAPLPGRLTELYWPPTVLADVPAGAALQREETFGPLAPVTAVDGDLDDMVRTANTGELGLSAAVFGRDIDRTLSVAGRLRAGQVVINDTSNYWELHMPFGGAPGRKSGSGRLGGRHAAEAVTEIQSITITLVHDWR
ncbi:MAG TPA: aldehyde dehydrogenase family protein [Streptosporangiaceae bacterium]|nr:aldehyde dehydrogenase family protein [Streptosporangiaceae bacterium]